MSTPSPRGSAPDVPTDGEIGSSAFAEPADRPSRISDETRRRSVVTIAGAVASDMSGLVQGHVELAKIEIQASAKAAGRSVGMFGGAAAFFYFSVFMLMVAAAEGMVALGLWRWLSYLIVGVFLILLAGILIYVGQRGLKGVKGMPKTQASITKSSEHLSKQTAGTREAA